MCVNVFSQYDKRAEGINIIIKNIVCKFVNVVMIYKSFFDNVHENVNNNIVSVKRIEHIEIIITLMFLLIN